MQNKFGFSYVAHTPQYGGFKGTANINGTQVLTGIWGKIKDHVFWTYVKKIELNFHIF